MLSHYHKSGSLEGCEFHAAHFTLRANYVILPLGLAPILLSPMLFHVITLQEAVTLVALLK